MKRQRAIIGIRLNYGMQQWYRDRGIEPCCGICVHFTQTPVNLVTGGRICGLRGVYVEPREVCYSPLRAPGADDED